MAAGVEQILGRVQDHALVLGHFESVNGHEPKRAPQTGGLTAAVWLDRITGVPSSGLDSTSSRVTVQGRIYGSMLAEPQDEIDPGMSRALTAWFGALVGDLQLRGPAGAEAVVRTIDVRGIHGVPLDAVAGYVEQDKKLFRVYTITIPCIVNDLFPEAQ